jgi:hypothetical protein
MHAERLPNSRLLPTRLSRRTANHKRELPSRFNLGEMRSRLAQSAAHYLLVHFGQLAAYCYRALRAQDCLKVFQGRLQTMRGFKSHQRAPLLSQIFKKTTPRVGSPRQISQENERIGWQSRGD